MYFVAGCDFCLGVGSDELGGEVAFAWVDDGVVEVACCSFWVAVVVDVDVGAVLFVGEAVCCSCCHCLVSFGGLLQGLCGGKLSHFLNALWTQARI